MILGYVASITTHPGLVVTSRLNTSEYPTGPRSATNKWKRPHHISPNKHVRKTTLSLPKLITYFCAPPKLKPEGVRDNRLIGKSPAVVRGRDKLAWLAAMI